MLIGLDFDNTLAAYDRVFSDAAHARGYIDGDSILPKIDVRTRIRALAGGEEKWKALQGEVYGRRMKDAELMPGADAFLARCKANGVDVVIVSHKTPFGHYDPDQINLHDAARAWMTAQGFFDPDHFGLGEDAVYFETTRSEKVARLAGLGCTHFVDDLEEVFLEPEFPDGVTRILYDPSGSAGDEGPFERHSDWKSIERTILGD